MTTTNHHSLDLPQAWPWKDHHHCYVPNQQQYHYYVPGGGHQHQMREHLFEKPLTPSDVGKLNRLVIPKQHAEKHFPLDAESGEKGLLLSFEDEAGKSWRFRYSYWTSSQSYVLTKGWSRFVKEKRLDAGDIVLFERRRSDAGRLYIGWRRRGDPPPATTAAAQWGPVYYGCSAQPYGPGASSASQLYIVGGATATAQDNCYIIQGGGGGAVAEQGKEEEKKKCAVSASKYSKRLRLFGVNLDCSGLDGPDSPDRAQRMELHQFMPCTGSGSHHP